METRTTTRPRPRLFPRTREPRRPAPAPTRSRLGPRETLALALWFGLATGLLELGGELVRRALEGKTAWLGAYQLNRHYLWMTPASSLLVFALAGLVLSGLVRLWPRHAPRIAAGVIVGLAALTLLTMVRALVPAASLVLAAGAGVRASGIVERQAVRLRRSMTRSALVLLLGVLALAGFSFGREAAKEHHALSRRPSAPAGAPNVLLIVLDATRADALSLYGAPRKTTPNLEQLARRGVTFDHARATAPWTLPSHACLFTGRWPYELNVGAMRPLDATYPTLAEHLRRSGYTTAGFAANYVFCTAAYGLGRGFAHYEDRPISIDDVLGSSSLGHRLIPALDAARDAWSRLIHGRRCVNLTEPHYFTHAQTAAEINRAFLDWLPARSDRPFFAFLNYFDAHAPYIPPEDWDHHFGRVPETPDDIMALRTWEEDWHMWNPKRPKDAPRLPSRGLHELARDGYDDCVAYMDRQIGHLLSALDRRGVLSNTLVIVTADHGEGFGEHGLYCHFVSVHRSEIDVPLVVSMPGRVPEGLRVSAPASLRDIPATVVDLLRLSHPSPFPGRSLSRLWSLATASDAADEPVLSELSELSLRALMIGSKIYIHHRDGSEKLFDIATDPGEVRDLAHLPSALSDLERFRRQIAQVPLKDAPAK